MSVNANHDRRQLLANRFCDIEDFLRNRAAVGITKNDYIGTGFGSSSNNLQSVFGIGFIAIVKVFGIKNDFHTLGFQELYRFVADVEIFVK